MLSSRQSDESKTSDTVEVKVLTDTNLKGDWSNFFLLILLYTVQGVSLGLIKSIPILLKSRPDGTYNEQALFSFSEYPFSLKLLWAPLVDVFYLHKCGRRKSWLVPTQLLIGAMLIFIASVIDIFLPETGKPNFIALITVFGALDFLSATQDIVVDGWALSMLKRNNVGYASTCNMTGIALGMLLGKHATILLTSKDFCMKYFRDASATEGIVSFNSLLFGWGITFMVLSTLIALFKKEKDSTLDDDYLKSNIFQNYLQLWNILKIRNVQILAAALITGEIGFASIDFVINFKLMDAGVSKEEITILQSGFPGINIIVLLLVAKHTSGPKAIGTYLKLVPYRLLLNLVFPVFIYFTPAMIKNNDVINIPVYYYLILVLLAAIHNIIMYVMYVTLFSFFNRISDPRFGGTYMTLLNTLLNLGYKLSGTLALGLINLLTIEKCSPDYPNIHAKSKDDCVIVDGFYLETILCTIIGIIWMSIFGNKLKRFQTLSPLQWLIHGKTPVVAVDENAGSIAL